MSNPLFAKVGGRKAAFGLLAAILLTAMAFPLDATFSEYMMGILGALGLTSAAVAWEDAKTKGVS